MRLLKLAVAVMTALGAGGPGLPGPAEASEPPRFLAPINLTDSLESSVTSVLTEADGRGNIHVLFAGDSLYYRMFDRQSGSWGSVTNLSHGIAGDSVREGAIALDSVGNLHVLFSAVTPGNGTTAELYYRRKTTGGWDPDTSLSALLITTRDAHASRDPDLAVDPYGGLVLCWDDGACDNDTGLTTGDSPFAALYASYPACKVGTQVYMARLDTNFDVATYDEISGTRVTGLQTSMEDVACDTIGKKAHGTSNPSIAISQNGVLHLAWEDDRFVSLVGCPTCAAGNWAEYGPDEVFYQQTSVDTTESVASWTWSDEVLMHNANAKTASGEADCAFPQYPSGTHCGTNWKDLYSLAPQLTLNSLGDAELIYRGDVYDYDSSFAGPYRQPLYRSLDSAAQVEGGWAPPPCENAVTMSAQYGCELGDYFCINPIDNKRPYVAVDKYDRIHVIWPTGDHEAPFDSTRFLAYNLGDPVTGFDAGEEKVVSGTADSVLMRTGITADKFGHVHIFYSEYSEATGAWDIMYVEGLNPGNKDSSDVSVSVKPRLFGSPPSSKSNEDSMTFCPAGDYDTMVVTVTVRDDLGDPVAGIPADSILVTLSLEPADTTLDSLFCGGPFLHPDAATDTNGVAVVEVKHIGGCGTLYVGASVCGNAIARGDTVLINSPEINGACPINFSDTNRFLAYLSAGAGWCGDFNHDSIVNFTDTNRYTPHLIGGDTCPGKSWELRTDEMAETYDGENGRVVGSLVEGGSGAVDVALDGLASVRAAYVEVRYPQGLEFAGWAGGEVIRADVAFGDVRVDENTVGITIGQVGDASTIGRGVLARLSFRGEPSLLGEIRLRELIISDRDFRLNAAALEPGSQWTEGEALTPARFYFRSFPNPFNPAVTLAYGLTEASDVRIVVYSVGGRVIRSLVYDREEAGQYQVVWDGRDDLGRDVGSGRYFARIRAGERSGIERVLLVR